MKVNILNSFVVGFLISGLLLMGTSISTNAQENQNKQQNKQERKAAQQQVDHPLHEHVRFAGARIGGHEH